MSKKVVGGGKKTLGEDDKTRKHLIRFKKPTPSMVELAKKLEAMDPRDWHVEGGEFDDVTEQETNSSVIILLTNHLYNNETRPKGMTVREIVTSLQFLSKSDDRGVEPGRWSKITTEGGGGPDHEIG